VLSGLRAIGTGPTRPYVLFGAGGYHMQIEGVSRNPYGTIGAVFAGAGIEHSHGGWRLFGESRGKLTLSDYGSQEFSPGLQFPTVVGVGRAIPSPDVTTVMRQGRDHPDLASWAPDRSRLLMMPSGRGLGAGAIQVAVTAPWTPFVALGMVEDNLLFLRPSVALGLTDWLSVHGGFWPQAIPMDRRSPVHQEGQIFGGAELTLPLGDWSFSGGTHLTHPRGNEFGRTISESVFYGAAYRETASAAYTLGAGWRGFPRGGDQRGWSGGGFLMGGVQRPLFPNLEAVADGYLGDGSIALRPGLRTGVLGLSLEASYGCALYAGMGIGGRCEGPNVTAAYRLELPGRP